ncbi:hypothetical protein [Listeria booriae]|uniref:hypothetical protein n=1 Tax=Listeria booriae TaxID=1552123 RepID=UPI00162A9705|nr:hypothetical protein [Listeria booriae]MBC1228608.1 hypothetical protein [Listeria booriae]MBC1248125.1 hypothetical protein [Listeria booriae]MBC1287302.1 hypothetical protein [Listeria booriae]
MEMTQTSVIPGTRKVLLKRQADRSDKWVLIHTVIFIRGIDLIQPAIYQEKLRQEVHDMSYQALLKECKVHFKEMYNIQY